MPENKTTEFLKKLAPCIERGELEACVEEAARVAGEMGIGAEELLDISKQMWMSRIHAFAYVFALVAAQVLEGTKKAGAYNNAGLAVQSIGKMEKAEEHFRKAIEANPKLAETHSNYANLLKELNRKEEAEEQYKEAIEANPKYAAAHSNYAVLLRELNRKEEAEEQYKEAIEANPKLAEAHSNYANLLKELNRKDEAEEQYKEAIKANPKYAEAHTNYANLLKDLKRVDKAEKYYQKAIEINTNLAEAHYNYAILLKDLKRVDEAEKHYQKAIEINTNYDKAHGAYGLLLIDLDKREDAWKETELASNLFKESGRVTESYLAKAWFYQRYADKNLERNRYKESSEDINKAGEGYLKAAESVEAEIKYALELRGNEFKAKSFIRKPHKNIYELIDNLKEAAAFYKKASICPVNGKQEVCNACHSVITVFSLVLEALDDVVNDEQHSIKREEWSKALELPHLIYIKNKSKKGAALVVALNQLIRCVDELADYKARKSSVQEKRLKDCYNNLLEVSSKVEGGLKNITDPASDIIKDYARKKGIPISDEKVPEVPPLYLRLIKPIIGAIIAIILGIIANRLFSWNLDLKIINFIKSLLP